MPRWTTEYMTFSTSEPYMTITAPTVFIDEILRVVATIDRQDVQLSVHALVTELSEDATKALGLTWSADSSRTPLPVGGAEALTHGLNQFTASHADSSLGFTQQFGATATIGRFTHEGLLTLNSLLASGKARIRVDTAIVTQNGQEARLQFGREQFFKIETGTVAFPRIDLERIESGISLAVTPQVAENGDITMDLDPTVSDVVAIGPEGLPILQKRTVKNRVRVADGETVVIAGLVEERRQEQIRKIPLLGSIPFIGRLFQSRESVASRKEVAIFITPRILGTGTLGAISQTAP